MDYDVYMLTGKLGYSCPIHDKYVYPGFGLLRLICAAACDVYCLQHNPQQFRNLFITERRNSVSLSVQMWDTLCPTGIHPPFFWYVGNQGNPYTCHIVLFSFQELWVAKSGFSKPWSRFLKSGYVYMHKFKKGYFKNPMSSLLQRNLRVCTECRVCTLFFCIMTWKKGSKHVIEAYFSAPQGKILTLSWTEMYK